MKKTYLLIALAAMIGFVSCSKSDDNSNKPLNAELTLTSGIPSALVYGEPITIKGTVTSNATIKEYSLIAVKQVTEGEYTPVGSAQTYSPSTGEFSIMYFPDSKEMTGVAFTVVGESKSKTFYYPITSITGDAKGDVYVNKQVTLYADSIVRNHENTPALYPEVNTGAGSTTKSFFSMHGTTINGVKEHILSLNDLRALDGKNASFCFLNVLQNTSNNAIIGSQRGYMFSGMRKASLGGGTTGRQCDIYQVGGHAIADANIDYDFGMTVINGSWIGESYNEAAYKFVDSLFLAIGTTATTTADKLKVFYQLSEVQAKLDNSTLGVTESPTSLANKTYVRRYTNAGTSGTSALSESLRAGDYIIIRSKRGTAETPVYYYGIMQVSYLYDDSSAFVDVENVGKKIDATLALGLFMRPVILNVKTQCEL